MLDFIVQVNIFNINEYKTTDPGSAYVYMINIS